MDMSESYDAESATGVLEAVETDSSSTMSSQTGSLEQALAEIEAGAGDLVKTTKQVMASCKKIKDAAKVGDLVELRKLLDEGKAATLELGCDFLKTQPCLRIHPCPICGGPSGELIPGDRTYVDLANTCALRHPGLVRRGLRESR